MRHIRWHVLGLWACVCVLNCRGEPTPVPPICPVSIPTTPSTGPISVEWTHGDGKVTVQLGGAGFPVVVNPATGKRWILMQVKED